jgi:ribosome biogenesis GTPase A
MVACLEVEGANYNWFPGHIAQTRRNIKEHIFKADLVVEILDSRIPWTSRSYLLEESLKKKKRIILLNKSDLSDPTMTKKWLKYYRENGGVISVSSHCSTSSDFARKIYRVLKEVKSKLKKVRLHHRIIVIGIPNVGKSRFINGLVGKKKAKVENRPGVTRGPQWIKIGEGYELMDLPGVLAPSVVDNTAAIKLALCNSMSREAVDLDVCIDFLIEHIRRYKPKSSHKFINIALNEENPVVFYAASLNFMTKGGIPDTTRAMQKLLKDFDRGKLGKMTFDSLLLTKEPGDEFED